MAVKSKKKFIKQFDFVCVPIATPICAIVTCRQDWRKSPELVNILEEANQEVPEWLRRESIR